jgi:hypothetical protein
MDRFFTSEAKNISLSDPDIPGTDDGPVYPTCCAHNPYVTRSGYGSVDLVGSAPKINISRAGYGSRQAGCRSISHHNIPGAANSELYGPFHPDDRYIA